MIDPKVALIGPVPEEFGGRPGGVATHQAYLAKGLAAAGARVSLLATSARAAGPDDPVTFEPLPIYRMWLPRNWTDWADPRYVSAVGLQRLLRYAAFVARQQPGSLSGSRRVLLGELLWYARYLSAVRPNVVHVQHPLERHLYVRLLRRLEPWRPRLVVTLHSLFGEHSEDVVLNLMAPNLVHADRLIAVSPHVAEQALQLGADRDRLRVIPSGVDTDRFRPLDRLSARTDLGLAPDQRIVLFVGTLEPRKQLDRLLLALPAVRAAVPTACVVLVGTGEQAGSDDQTQLLKDIIRENRLSDAVHFVGRVSESELLQWYSAADVFVLPSSSEGQGLAALEAMACGLPVVASAVGALPETIEDGISGVVVSPGDVADLARHLIGLLSDPCQRAQMGAAARERVRQRFSWQRTIEQTSAVYHEVLSKPPRV